MPETAPILLLPGLGADTRMFDPLRAEGLRIQSPPWIDPLPREPLAEYAERFAAAMPEAAPVIGGASFGGMLALEMAQRLRPRTVILLGSCASPDRLRRGERLIGARFSHAADAAAPQDRQHRCRHRPPWAYGP